MSTATLVSLEVGVPNVWVLDPAFRLDWRVNLEMAELGEA